MGKSDLIDLDVQKHHETEKAWLVSGTGDRDDAVWIAKSQAQGKRTVGVCEAIAKKMDEVWNVTHVSNADFDPERPT